jgi:hypothetical protein
MLLYATLIFTVAAIGGTYMAYRILNGELAPWAVSLLHAGLGAVGLVFTALAVMAGAGGPVMGPMTLVTLLVAALGGFYLASLHKKKRLASSGLVITHATVAITGVLFLIGIAFLFDTLTHSLHSDVNNLKGALQK